MTSKMNNSKDKKRTLVKRVIMGLVLAIFIFCMVLPAFAASEDFESAPIATHMEYGEELVSFRVWVLPGLRNGTQVSGYYEYFDMMMDMGNAKEVIDTQDITPAVQAIPIKPGTTPAVPPVK